MKKIVFITSFAPSLINFKGQLIKDCIKEKNSVCVMAPDMDQETASTLRALGVSIEPIFLNKHSMNPIKELCSLISIISTLRKISPDIVINYAVKPIIYGSIASKFCKIEKVFSIITGLGYIFMGLEEGISENIFRKNSRKIAQYLYKIAVSFNTMIFFQNIDDQLLLLDLGVIKKDMNFLLVNGSGVDTDYYRIQPLPEETTFLLIARLLYSKGIENYANAARKLKKKYPNFTFQLAGWFDTHPSSISKDTIEKWIKHFGIDYLGTLADVRQAISLSSVYVLPSYREGTSRTIMEAMSMGRPIVTTNAPGCSNLVSDGYNGILVPINNDLELENAMEKIGLDHSLRQKMGKRSRKIIEEKFDVHIINQLMLKAMGLR